MGYKNIGAVKIYIFRIKIWQDLEYAKKNFPRIAYYMAYLPASKSIYETIKSLTKIKLSKFNPHYEKNKYVLEQECETLEESKEQKKKIEAFFLGDMKEFQEKEEVKRVLANRTIKGLIKKAKDKLINYSLSDGQVLQFLNKFSIYASWDVEKKERFINK